MIERAQDDIIRKWPKEWMTPMVSIRCLTYNHERCISQAMDSFLMQDTFFPFEIVVHDDASTDGTANILKEYEKKYPKIVKPIYEKENLYSKGDGSLTRVMNNACRGKYIAFCEGDDYWVDPLKLQKQYDVFQSDKSVTLVHTGFCSVDMNGELLDRPKYEKLQRVSRKEKGIVSLFDKNHVMTLSVMCPKSLLLSDLYQQCPLKYDYSLAFAAAFLGKIVFLPQKMGAYRMNPLGMMHTKIRKVNNDLYVVYKYFADYYFKAPDNGHLLFDQLQIAFFMETMAVYHRDVAFLKKILKTNACKIFLLPFSLCFAILKKIKRKL